MLVCAVCVSCAVIVHVCVCLDISACRVSVSNIPVSVRKARCRAKWRLFLDFLTFRVSVGVGCWTGVVD